jgi:hypothetical protein
MLASPSARVFTSLVLGGCCLPKRLPVRLPVRTMSSAAAPVVVVGRLASAGEAAAAAAAAHARSWLYLCTDVDDDDGLDGGAPALQAALPATATFRHEPLDRAYLHPDVLERLTEVIDALPRPLVMSCRTGHVAAAVWVAYRAAQTVVAADRALLPFPPAIVRAPLPPPSGAVHMYMELVRD